MLFCLKAICCYDEGMKMHADEVATSASLARNLIRTQFPQWGDLKIKKIKSTGTDHAIYRLGTAMAVRLPLVHWATDQAAMERKWLPRIASFLPLEIPEQLAQGKPTKDYPYAWSIYKWLNGEDAITAKFDNPNQAAHSLATFLVALREIDTKDGPRASEHKSRRGLPLSVRDADVCKAIVDLGDKIDSAAVTAAWEKALTAPEWDRAPTWFHGDLLPGNILVSRGKPSSVIDWSNLAIGDPACDLMIAWRLFSGESRETFRKTLAIDDATWARGRGHALAQALIFIPYYINSNPTAVEASYHAVNEVLADV